MLRLVIVLLLLAANGLMLAWQQGWMGGVSPAQQDREPDRMKRQINPELVKVLSPSAASAALAEAARAGNTTSAPAEGTSSTPSAAVPGAAPAASSPAAASAVGSTQTLATTVSAMADTLCLEAGPFALSELPAAVKVLRDTSLPTDSWTTVNTQRKGSYLIYMGRYADAALLARKQAELQRLKVDNKPLTDWPDLQPGLVLGRYDDRATADGAQAGLMKRGVRTSRVVTLTPAVTLAALRVPAATADQRSQLAGLKLPPGNIAFGPCQGEPHKA